MIVIDVSLILRKHVNNREGIIRNQEFYIETGEGYAVNTIGIILIRGTGIVGKDCQDPFPFFFGKLF